MISTHQVAILGSGSWGTALGTLLAHHFDEVVMIGREDHVAQEINEFHKNSLYLPGLKLPENIRATTDLTVAKSASLVLMVIPSAGVRSVASELAKIDFPKDIVIVSCTKGIEHNTGERMSEIIHELLPDNPLAALSGPNHAEEVSRELTSCAVIGSKNEALASHLQGVFSTSYFRSYTSNDIAAGWNSVVPLKTSSPSPPVSLPV